MLRWVTRFVCPVFLLAPALLAQSEVGTASLNGTVTDPSGAAVIAKVIATNEQNGLVRTVEANQSGQYSIVRLPVGLYTISANYSGFKESKKTGVQLTVGAAATLDFALQVGSAQETVTVTAEVPIVETTRTQTSTVVNETAIRDLPVNGRNFLDFTLLTPGVTRDPRGGDLSFGGQRGTANSLLVDGGDNNNLFFGQSSGRIGVRNPYAFSEDSVQEFQVNTSTFSAEIGRAGGGVINVVTKSGTNAFHGTAFEFFRDKGMNANNSFNKSRGRAKAAYHFNQFGGNLGGPVKKDKLFFFFNYDGQRNASPNVVIFGANPPSDAASQAGAGQLSQYLNSYATSLKNDTYLGKVDWNLSANDTLMVRYNAGRFTGVNFENAGPTSIPDHTGNSSVNTDNVSLTNTHIFSPNLVLDSRFIFLKDDEPGAANSSLPETIIQQNGVTALAIGRNNFSPRYTNTKRYQTIQSVSYIRGSHTFKAGFDFNFERIDNFFPGFFSGSYTFASFAAFAAKTPVSFTQAFPGAGTSGALTEPNIDEYAFFAQDTWRVNNKLTLNYGIRYDLMDSASGKVLNTDPGLISQGLYTNRMNLDTNNIAPRFGFAYKILDSDKLVIRGGAGTFYARTPAIVTGTTHSQNGIQVQTYTLSGTAIPAYPNILSAPPTASRTIDLYLFAPNYVQPATNQFSLNVEYQVAPNLSVTVGYLGVRGEHLTRVRDINLFPEEAATGTINGTTPITFTRHATLRPNPNFRRITVVNSDADSIYHAGFLQVNKRFNSGLQFQAAYTYSKVIDDDPEQTAVVVGTDDAKLVRDSLQPNQDRARGDADLRHRFVFAGVYEMNLGKSIGNPILRGLTTGYQFSTITTLQSGRYFNQRVGGDVNNDSNRNTDRVPGVGRNTLEGPGFVSLDARITKDIPLFRESVRLRLIGEAFNLTNRTNISGFDQTLYNFNPATSNFTTNPSYLTTTGTFDPRILQLAAKFIF